MRTVAAVTVRAVSLWVQPQHAGHVRAFHEGSVKHVLPQVVELAREHSSADSNSIVALFPHHSVQHFGEPPDTYVTSLVPFLCQWFFTEKMAKLIFNLKYN